MQRSMEPDGDSVAQLCTYNAPKVLATACNVAKPPANMNFHTLMRAIMVLWVCNTGSLSTCVCTQDAVR